MPSEQEHIPDEILTQYADDPQSVPDREAIESHLAVCAACWTRLDDLRTLGSAMADGETWWAVDQIAGDKGLRALREFTARLDAEDAEAARMLEPLLDSQYRFTYANIIRKPRFRTGGVVRLLSRTARSQFLREPLFALVLADVASAIAASLPDDYYPSAAVNDLRGNAWKEYATACRYLGRLQEGFDALDRAERAYRRLPDPVMQLARVALARATMLFEQQRYDEALPLARTAATQFEQRRAADAYLDAKEWEALILHRLGDLAAARETYERVFAFADTLGNAEMKARAARNLAVACADRGDTGRAMDYLLIALQIYEALGQRAMVVHTRWSIAWVSLLAGNAIFAADRLPAIIADLIELGMSGDAARAQLDLAEALLVLKRLDEVRAVCGVLFSFFRSANMLSGALTAAAFLQEQAQRRTLTRGHIAWVRDYLARVEHSRELPFAPPPEPPDNR
jgi:tetratricopeptide (TPR) repeat protein